jgi:hypothetical protein
MYACMCVCVYMHTRFIRTDDEMCVYVVLSIQPKCHPPLSPYLPGGKREGNKCVVRERGWWWHSSPLRLVSSFSFFFLFFWLVCRWKKVFLLPCRKFILLSLPIYAVNQSFRLSIHIRLSSFNVLFNVLRQA